MYRASVAVCVLAALIVPTASAAPSFVIRGDSDIGGLALAKYGSLRHAIEKFGQPTSYDKNGWDTCAAGWRSFGIRSIFTSSPDDPCADFAGARGCHVRSTISGRQWKTAKGLRIGDPARKIRRLYPKARPYIGRDWSLVRRKFGGVWVPSLTATVQRGKVQAFVVKSFWLFTC
jgi:hypothetical protein